MSSARYKVDIVHARSRAPAWSAWAAARRTGKPFVTTFHNAYGAGSKLKRYYNSVMARGARVIAISKFVGDYAASVYGVSRERLRVIPRGVDINRFDPAKVNAGRVAALRREWNLPEGAPVIMLPGRLTRWKGQLVLVEALAKLGRRDVIVRDRRRRLAGFPAGDRTSRRALASIPYSASSTIAAICRRPTCWPI